MKETVGSDLLQQVHEMSYEVTLT